MAKKLMILGGSRYIVPVIEAAHEMDIEVVTCDYLPDNTAHAFSDIYENASIVDKDAVFEAARRLRVDGIMSFAADPGVVSAAYAAERLGLPFQGSLEAVSILQNKGRFRSFLRENSFNCPFSFVANDWREAAEKLADSPFPAIVKPTDAAGSKGVTRVDAADELEKAVNHALDFSQSGTCIIEQFLEKAHPSSDADGFVVGGRLSCASFTSQLFDLKAPNPFTPAAYTMPAAMPLEHQGFLKAELQRLSDLLSLDSGVFNIETRVATDGKPYIMEMSPRGGGNRLCEMLHHASGIDLVKASVQAAVGLPITGVGEPAYDGFWYQEILHSNIDGRFSHVEYAAGFKRDHVVEEQVWIKPGDNVNAFTAANHAFGTVFLRFDGEDDLEAFCSAPQESMRVVLS